MPETFYNPLATEDDAEDVDGHHRHTRVAVALSAKSLEPWSLGTLDPAGSRWAICNLLDSMLDRHRRHNCGMCCERSEDDRLVKS